MPISQTDQLFKLIKSLTKAEKRNFTVYANRIQDSENLKYMQLFDLMDKQTKLDETQITAKLKDSDKTQYSNLKRHLYKQIMISLRLIYIDKKTDIKIREYLDFADILYSKGLYLQSLKLINTAKTVAEKSNNNILKLSLLESEKIIESKHITRSGTSNTNKITKDSVVAASDVMNSTLLTNLGLLIHAFYINKGHVKNEAQKKEISEFFEQQMPKIDINMLHFHEKVYLYQSLVWYYYILLDFSNCMNYALKWVESFYLHPSMLEDEADLFMRGYHYILTCAFYLDEKEKYLSHLEKLEKFRKESYGKMSPITQIVSFIYVHSGRLNKYILLKRYEEGLTVIPKTIKRITRYKDKLDGHRIMVFYFKFAWMYLMAKQPSKAVDYLNEIQKMEVGALREDIQIYTRIMLLMAHYDLGNLSIMDYLLSNVKQIAIKFSETNPMQTLALQFFSRITRIPVGDRKKETRDFLSKMEVIKANPFERRGFMYLDITEWLKTKT
jgi:hypothetical protein